MHTATCLRIYLSEGDRIGGEPAVEAVLRLCRDAGLAGITVSRAIEGLGQHGVHTASFLSLASRLPLIVEAIDNNEAIERAAAMLQPQLGHRLMACWPVTILNYRGG